MFAFSNYRPCITCLTYRYDFNSDGFITKEDVRIVFSYIPFKRDLPKEEALHQRLPSLNFSEQVNTIMVSP